MGDRKDDRTGDTASRATDATPRSEAWWATAARPLSDIRELTEPSLLNAANRRGSSGPRHRAPVARQSSLKRADSNKRAATVRIVSPDKNYRGDQETSDSQNTTDSPRDASSVYSVPLSSVPPRASSRTRATDGPIWPDGSRTSPTPMQRRKPEAIVEHGYSQSPMKQANNRLAAVTADPARHASSKTFVRRPLPKDILEFPTHRHPRIAVDLQVTASLHVGGGSIEGYIRIVVNETDKARLGRDLMLGGMSVDLIGAEETNGNRKTIFLTLGVELIDKDNPPPRNMIDATAVGPDAGSFWTLIPSVTTLPFRMNLPLDTGPPPFQSRQARIRFLLCATLLVKDHGKPYLVRSSQDVAVLSTYDPEKALRSLPSPLTASDEYYSTKSGKMESVKLTAGLHRQVWVSGNSIFVDIHIANSSRRTIKKLDLSIERNILCYRHAAAGTLEQSASQARMFDSNDRTMINQICLKNGAQGWTGLEAYETVTRSCDLHIPHGHGTVKCGKHFEVRYFLNISVSASYTSVLTHLGHGRSADHLPSSKLVSVQLPIILIHMNSLDVVPNAVDQVAVAIAEKRANHHRGRSRGAPDATTNPHSRHKAHHDDLASQQNPSSSAHHPAPSTLQGRAFAAPRQQSLDRMRAERADLQHLGDVLDSSPRKHVKAKPSVNPTTIQAPSRPPSRPPRKHPSASSLGGISIGGYAVVNDSSGSGSNSNGGKGMSFVTPPRPTRFYTARETLEAEEPEGVREKLRQMQPSRSVESGASRFEHQRTGGEEASAGRRTVTEQRIESGKDGGGALNAYALGLGEATSTTAPPRSRFEVRTTVKRKGSIGGFKDWLHGLKRDR